MPVSTMFSNFYQRCLHVTMITPSPIQFYNTRNITCNICPWLYRPTNGIKRNKVANWAIGHKQSNLPIWQLLFKQIAQVLVLENHRTYSQCVTFGHAKKTCKSDEVYSRRVEWQSYDFISSTWTRGYKVNTLYMPVTKSIKNQLCLRLFYISGSQKINGIWGKTNWKKVNHTYVLCSSLKYT